VIHIRADGFPDLQRPFGWEAHADIFDDVQRGFVDFFDFFLVSTSNLSFGIADRFDFFMRHRALRGYASLLSLILGRVQVDE
jgi:hypothetical protein